MATGSVEQQHGLFEVVPGIYQVRGFDAAAYKLLKENVADLPITTIIFTHSHANHYGGSQGLVKQEDVDSGKVTVVAPKDFFKESISENVMAGNAMSRRALFMYGSLLPKDEKGGVDIGLGKQLSVGTISILKPNVEIEKTGEKLTVDGVEFEFVMASGTEAPAEFMFYIPKYKAFCSAEVVTHTLHNLSTLRGAKTRDALVWSKSIDTAKNLYGDKSEIMFSPHHWPKWGNKNIAQMLEKQRDIYKYIHDQSLGMANNGYTPIEIAEMIEIPASLNSEFYNRGYYGTVNHDSKAVYDRYFGAWWDGNPANLYKLPPAESAKRYVEFMGGEDNVLKMAKESYDKGDYRWVVEVLNHVVFANPSNQAARNLEADAMEQLGYQSESGVWRGYFLTGALELRNGIKEFPVPATASPATLEALTLVEILDYMSLKVDPVKAEGLNLEFNIALLDTKENVAMELKNSTLNARNGSFKNPTATIETNKKVLNDILLGQTTFQKALDDGNIKIDNRDALEQLLSVFKNFNFWFKVVEPNP